MCTFKLVDYSGASASCPRNVEEDLEISEFILNENIVAKVLELRGVHQPLRKSKCAEIIFKITQVELLVKVLGEYSLRLLGLLHQINAVINIAKERLEEFEEL